jgi:nucleoporin NUP159
MAYNVEDALNQKDPAFRVETDPVGVRALVPNPQTGCLFAAVFDSGKLAIVDILKQKLHVLQNDNVTCVAWSTKGRALVCGMQDGSALQYKVDGGLMCTVPRPPGTDPNYFGR